MTELLSDRWTLTPPACHYRIASRRGGWTLACVMGLHRTSSQAFHRRSTQAFIATWTGPSQAWVDKTGGDDPCQPLSPPTGRFEEETILGLQTVPPRRLGDRPLALDSLFFRRFEDAPVTASGPVVSPGSTIVPSGSREARSMERTWACLRRATHCG